MTIKLISVLIPCKNPHEKYFLECLEAIKSQDYAGETEILVLDNNSTNSAFIRSACDRYKFCYYRTDRDGIGYARKRLVELSKGEYVAFCSADDVWEKHFLSTMVREAERQPRTVLYSHYKLINAEGCFLRDYVALGFDDDVDFSIACLHQLRKNTMFVMFDTVFIPKEVFRTHNFCEDLRQSEDADFLLYTMLDFPYKLVPEFLVRYRVHGESTTTTSGVGKIEEVNAGILRRFEKYVGERDVSKDDQNDVLLVNYEGFESKGGVVSMWSVMRYSLFGVGFNPRLVSYVLARGVVDPYNGLPLEGDELFKTSIIEEYLGEYFFLFSKFCVLVVSNVGCCNVINKVSEYDVPLLNVWQDPYKLIYEELARQGYYDIEVWRRFVRVMPFLQREASKGTNVYNVPVSDVMRGVMLREGVRPIPVLPNCVVTSFWKPLGLPKKGSRFAKYKGVVLWVGGLHPNKGFHHVQKLVHECSDVFFILVFKHKLQLGERVLAENVWIVEEQGADFLVGLYDLADVTCCVSGVESFNLVALESLSCNTPIVVSGTGFVAEDTEWRDGFGVRVREWNDYARVKEGVLHVLENKEGYAPRELIIGSKYDFEVWKLEFLKLLRDVIARKVL